jgi:hypothetical protein
MAYLIGESPAMMFQTLTPVFFTRELDFEIGWSPAKNYLNCIKDAIKLAFLTNERLDPDSIKRKEKLFCEGLICSLSANPNVKGTSALAGALLGASASELHTF